MDSEKLKSKVEEQKSKLLDRIFEVVDHAADQFTSAAKHAVAGPSLQLSIDSLQILLSSVQEQISAMGRNKYAHNVAFINYVKDELAQFIDVLERHKTEDELVESYRVPILEKFSSLYDEVVTVLRSRPRAKKFGRRITESEADNYVASLLEANVPKWRTELLMFCSQKLSSMAVIQRMQASKIEGDKTGRS